MLPSNPVQEETECLTSSNRFAACEERWTWRRSIDWYADDLLMSGVIGEPTYGRMAILDEVKRAIVEHENIGRRTRYDAA